MSTREDLIKQGFSKNYFNEPLLKDLSNFYSKTGTTNLLYFLMSVEEEHRKTYIDYLWNPSLEDIFIGLGKEYQYIWFNNFKKNLDEGIQKLKAEQYEREAKATSEEEKEEMKKAHEEEMEKKLKNRKLRLENYLNDLYEGQPWNIHLDVRGHDETDKYTPWNKSIEAENRKRTAPPAPAPPAPAPDNWKKKTTNGKPKKMLAEEAKKRFNNIIKIGSKIGRKRGSKIGSKIGRKRGSKRGGKKKIKTRRKTRRKKKRRKKKKTRRKKQYKSQ